MEKSYKEKVIEKYACGEEVNRAEKQGKYGMEFLYTIKVLESYIDSEKRVVELGCGGGYYLMHYAPKCKEYLGVDLSPTNVQITARGIVERGLLNARAEVGDATNLSEIADESYDVILCLGPMYHLNHEDRKKCIRECKRICEPGGILVFAYINKIGAIAKFGAGAGWDEVLTPEVGAAVMNRGTDDKNKDIFFFTMPEEMLADTEEAGLKKIRMTGVDFLVLEEQIEEFTDEQRRIWFQFADMVAESEYAVALSNHALLICQK